MFSKIREIGFSQMTKQRILISKDYLKARVVWNHNQLAPRI